MSVRRYGRPSPDVAVDRKTLLDESLTPTARLVYALLVASIDTETGLPRIAALAGLDSTDALKPFIDELQTVGAVEAKEHVGRGFIVAVYQAPLAPEQRSHPCVPCEDCGECSCEYMKGLCRDCAHIRSERRNAEDRAVEA